MVTMLTSESRRVDLPAEFSRTVVTATVGEIVEEGILRHQVVVISAQKWV